MTTLVAPDRAADERDPAPERGPAAELAPGSTSDAVAVRRRPGRRVPGTSVVFLVACLIGTAASVYTVHNGSNMDYGDSMAHLTIARRILDSKAPGLQQLGTVWLPLPHLLLMPLVQNLYLFRTGIAASILGTVCLGVSAAALWRIMARIGLGTTGRVTGLIVMLANPSLLYACTTALTEPVLIAAILSCIAGLAGWAFSPRRLSGGELAVFAGIPAAAGVLTRYEGWALVVSGAVFVGIVVLRRGDGLRRAVVLMVSFAGPPLGAIGWWLAYNTAWYGNPVEFLTGPYSAAAFTKVFQEQGMLTTKGNPGLSLEVLGRAILETVGFLPLVVAGIGLLVLTLRWGLDNRALVVWLAGTSSVFLLVSLTGGQHIMVNDSSLPTGAYNNRYVLSAVPWAALLCAFLVGSWSTRRRTPAPAAAARWARSAARPALLVGAAGVAMAALMVAQNVYWLGDPGPRMTVIQEAETDRAAFAPVKTMARWLHTHYDGGGILMDESTDRLAVAPIIGLPLSDYYNRAAGRYFTMALQDPTHYARWVVMHRTQVTTSATHAATDEVTAALAGDPQFVADYRLVYSVAGIGIYRRVSDPSDPPWTLPTVYAPGR